jgi:hypothetical protein
MLRLRLVVSPQTIKTTEAASAQAKRTHPTVDPGTL